MVFRRRINIMLCPSCKSELVITGQEKLETIGEHVSNLSVTSKDKYECLNDSCKLAGLDVCWNEDGEYYRSYSNRQKIDNDVFINGNTAPFGSMFRKINLECERDTYLLFTWFLWPWYGWQCFLEVTYKSDDDGNILRRYRRLQWVTNEGVHHVSTYRMVKHCVGRLINSRNRKKLLLEYRDKYGSDLWIVIMKRVSWFCLLFYK